MPEPHPLVEKAFWVGTVLYNGDEEAVDNFINKVLESEDDYLPPENIVNQRCLEALIKDGMDILTALDFMKELDSD